jgi:sugar lactone lactonase YvrE
VLGSGGTLRVLASGTQPLSYLWLKDDQPVPRGTNSTLSLTSVQPSSAGAYRVVVSNEVGVVTSSNALVRVVTTPVVLRQPVTTTAEPGRSVTFSVQAIGYGTLVYQWLRDGVPIPGAETASWTLPDAQRADEGEYSVRISNYFGSETSTGTELRLFRPPTEEEMAPGIRSLSVPGPAVAGASVRFEVVASGDKPVALQWNRDGRPLPGVTNAVWNRTDLDASQTGSYSVTVSNRIGSVTSDAVFFEVLPRTRPPNDDFAGREPLHLAPLASGSSFGATVEPQEPPPFSGRGGRSVWWYYRAPGNGTVTIGTTNSSIYAIVSVYTGDTLEGLVPVSQAASTAGPGRTQVQFHATRGVDYAVSVDDYYGSAGSISLSTTLHPDPPADQPPSFLSQPPPEAEILSGETLSLRFSATGAFPVRHAWYRDDRLLETFVGPELVLTNAQPGDSGRYRLVLSNANGRLESDPVEVRVAATLPRFSGSPIDRSITAGYPLTLSVLPTGTEPFSYQWRVDGRPIADATNRTFVRNLVVPDRILGFSVVVSNPVGSVTSRVAEVRVNPAGVRYRWSTFAGGGTGGRADGPASTARFSAPSGIARSSSGNLWVADFGSGRIRLISPAGEVATLSGPDGLPQSVNSAVDIALDGSGRPVVLSNGRGLVRFTAEGRQVLFSADPGWGLHLDEDGSTWFSSVGTVSKLDPDGTRRTLAAGTGVTDLIRHPNGNLLLADASAGVIRRMAADGTLTLFAGIEGGKGFADGPPGTARFSHPNSVSVDTAGNVFVADEFASAIRRIAPDGRVTTVGGRGSNGLSEGIGSEARFNNPRRVLAAPDGRLFVVDTQNHRIRVGEPLVPGAPSLDVRRDGDSLRFAWEPGDGLWVLESAASLDPNAHWEPVDPLQDTTPVLPVPYGPKTLGARYFRLRSP